VRGKKRKEIIWRNAAMFWLRIKMIDEMMKHYMYLGLKPFKRQLEVDIYLKVYDIKWGRQVENKDMIV